MPVASATRSIALNRPTTAAASTSPSRPRARSSSVRARDGFLLRVLLESRADKTYGNTKPSRQYNSRQRLVPATTISLSWLPQRNKTSRSDQSRTTVIAQQHPENPRQNKARGPERIRSEWLPQLLPAR